MNTAVAPRKCPCVRLSSLRQSVYISPISSDRGAAEVLPRHGEEDSSSLLRIQGSILPEESVKAVLRVVNEATQKDTGAFISHEGNKEWV